MRRFEPGLLMVIAACGGLALVPDAFAAGQARSGFQAMDADHDGKVSRDEHAAAAKRMFGTMDANKNGKVTAAEMDAAHERVTGQRAKKGDMTSAEKIKVIDTDADGVLTAEEHAAGSAETPATAASARSRAIRARMSSSSLLEVRCR